MKNQQIEMIEKYKFYVCSAGKPDSDYDDANFSRCVKYSAHFQYYDCRHKGPFNDITPPAVAILKYKSRFVAYGEIVKAWVDDDNEELEGWTYRVDVKEWIWKNPYNHSNGVPRNGIKGNVVKGDSFATIKQINNLWALKKINEINPNSDLAKKLNSLK